MASEQYTIIAATAGAALTQYQAVKLSSGDVIPTTAGDEVLYGIVQYDAASGDEVAVQVDGTGLALVDGSGTAIAVGDDLMAGSGGKLVKAVATTGNIYIGRALGASSGDGDFIKVQLSGANQYVVPA